MYEMEKRNCKSDGKRVKKGFLKDLIKEMKSTHGVPSDISPDHGYGMDMEDMEFPTAAM